MTTQEIDPYALSLKEFHELNDVMQQEIRRKGYEALSAEAFAHLANTRQRWVVYCGNPPTVVMEGTTREAPDDVVNDLAKIHGSLPWIFSSPVETGDVQIGEFSAPANTSSSTRSRKWHEGSGYIPM